MAKGDLLQMLQSNPDILNQLGLGNQGQLIGNAMKQSNPITGNPQNFMAGMRKTMGNPNPVSPYGFVPPNQRGPIADGYTQNSDGTISGGIGGITYDPRGGPMIRRQSPPAPQPSLNMGLPAQNTRFNPPSIGTPGYGAGGMGYKGGNRGGYPINGGNTGITGGKFNTYAPQNNFQYSGNVGGTTGQNIGMAQNNPYAPKSYGASWVTSPTTGKSGYVY